MPFDLQCSPPEPWTNTLQPFLVLLGDIDLSRSRSPHCRPRAPPLHAACTNQGFARAEPRKAVYGMTRSERRKAKIWALGPAHGPLRLGMSGYGRPVRAHAEWTPRSGHRFHSEQRSHPLYRLSRRRRFKMPNLPCVNLDRELLIPAEHSDLQSPSGWTASLSTLVGLSAADQKHEAIVLRRCSSSHVHKCSPTDCVPAEDQERSVVHRPLTAQGSFRLPNSFVSHLSHLTPLPPFDSSGASRTHVVILTQSSSLQAAALRGLKQRGSWSDASSRAQVSNVYLR